MADDELVIEFKVDEKSLTKALKSSARKVEVTTEDMSKASLKLAQDIEGTLVKAFKKQKQEQKSTSDTTARSTKEIRSSMQQQAISLEGTIQAFDKLQGFAQGAFNAMIQASPSASAQMALFDQQVQLLAMTFGEELAPIMEIVVNVFTDVTEVVMGMPGPIKMVIAVAIGLTVAAIVLSGALSALTVVSLPLIAVILLIAIVITALYYAWTNNLGGIQEKTQVVIEKITELFAELVTFVKEMIVEYKDEFMEMIRIIKLVWEKIQPFVKLIVELYYKNFVVFVKTIVALFKNSIMTMVHLVQGLVRIVKLLLKGDFKGAWNEAKKVIITFVKDNLKQFEIFFKGVKGIFNNIKDFVIGIWDTIFNDSLREKVGKAIEAIKKVKTGIVNVFMGIKNAISDFFTWVVDKVKELVEKVTGPIDSLGDKVRDAGGAVGDAGSKVGDALGFHGGGVFRAPTAGGEGVAVLKDKEGIFTQAQMKSLGLMASGGGSSQGLSGMSRTNNSGMTVVQVMNPVFRDQGDMEVFAQAIQSRDYQKISRENTTTR